MPISRIEASALTGSFLAVTWAGGGNVNPFVHLAQELRSRGHRVGALGSAPLSDRLAGAGLEVIGTASGWLPDADETGAAIEAFDPDVVIVDYMLPGCLCAAERAAVPTVALVHTLYTALLADGVPSPMNMVASVDATNQERGRLGLGPIGSHAELLARADLVMVTAPRELDDPGPVPTNLVYVGALFEGPGPDADWRPPSGAGPLVAVSVGTAGEPATETDLLRRVIDALGRLPVRGLVTVPDYIDTGALPSRANVNLSGYVRHSAVLPYADLLVTHAGLGSVLAALAYGVPMVCLPLGREQPANARAVTRLGAGRTLPPEAPVADIAAAIAAQLQEPRPVRIEPTPRVAVDRVERLLGRSERGS